MKIKERYKREKEKSGNRSKGKAIILEDGKGEGVDRDEGVK